MLLQAVSHGTDNADVAQYDTASATIALHLHVHAFFEGHEVQSLTWNSGPLYQRVPGFRAHAVAPGGRWRFWTYVTAGCWDAVNDDGHGMEFVIATKEFTMRAVEVLAMTAFFHAGSPHQRLDLGHTVTIGEPWLPGSPSDQALISLPYPWGPDLEVCGWEGGHARLLWLLPITQAEREFKRTEGVEALEQRFEDRQCDYTDPHRPSVV